MPYTSHCLKGWSLRRGFTLIELLVVIAILAALISILLPSYGTVREVSRSSMCLANMRTIGTAVPAYAGENDRYIVPGEYFISDADGETDTLETILAMRGYAQAQWTDDRFALPVGQTTFRCPSGEDKIIAITDLYNKNTDPYGPSSCYGLGRRHQVGGETKFVQTWYGTNLRTAEPRPFPFLRWNVKPGKKPNLLYKIDAVRAPSRLVALYDGVWSHNYWKYGRISARHYNRTRTNIAFFDGHCEPFDRIDLPFDGAGLKQTNPVWMLDRQ